MLLRILRTYLRPYKREIGYVMSRQLVATIASQGAAYASLYNAQFTGPRNGEAMSLGAAR